MFFMKKSHGFTGENELNQIERSISLILGILGNLAHFRHLFNPLYQCVIKRG